MAISPTFVFGVVTILACADELALVLALQCGTVAKEVPSSFVFFPRNEVKWAPEGVAHWFGIVIAKLTAVQDGSDQDALLRRWRSQWCACAVSDTSLVSTHSDAGWLQRWRRWNNGKDSVFWAVLHVTLEEHLCVMAQGLDGLIPEVVFAVMAQLPQGNV